MFPKEDFKPATQQAARLLAPQTFGDDSAIDWFFFTDLIAAAIKVLFTGCAAVPPNPTPIQAVNYLNWRPWIDPFGNRTARHHDTIRRFVAKTWRGHESELADVQDRLIDSIKAGKITPKMMDELYRENTLYRG